jgi:hypothetical protein
MPLRYAIDEEIQQGDKVLYDGYPAEIDFVAEPESLPAEDCYVQEFGGGVMVADPLLSGSCS